MNTNAKIVLNSAAGLIALGGLYDIFTPRLPPNLLAMCRGDEQARKLVRELLRALGGCLLAVGVTVAMLVNGSGLQDQRFTFGLVLVLVLPSEGANALGMYRVGSPYFIPLALIAITLAGVLLAV